MKRKLKNIVVMSLTMFFSPPVLAGSLDSPADPSHADSAMFTLTDIYNRLNDGTTGAKRSGGFVEPDSGPTAGTGYTLNDIMDIAPVINANGATSAEVLNGKFYWGLLNGLWGLQQGTATAGADVTGADGSLEITIPDGFYSNKTATANDSDLTAANIKNGINIFGVTGTYSEIGGNIQDTSSGDATTADIASGKKAWVDGIEVIGNVPAGNDVSGTDGQKTFTIPDGLYSGKTATANDTDLTATNIKTGVNIFGITGSVVEATGDATAADVLTSKTFSNSSGAGINGTMADKEGDNASTAQTADSGVNKLTAPTGFYDGDDTVTATDAEIAALDSDLTAENIKKDVDIFGVTGTYEAGPTCSGTLNGTRWCDNDNGTVTDMTTGLIWLQKADWGGQKQWDGNSNDNAHVRAGILKAEDEDWLTDGSEEGDWRLPTKNELVGITTGTEPVRDLEVEMRAFSGVQTGPYWSSSSKASMPSHAWSVDFEEGGVLSSGKTNTNDVWPVRGGQ
jgi:hypothetical protein